MAKAKPTKQAKRGTAGRSSKSAKTSTASRPKKLSAAARKRLEDESIALGEKVRKADAAKRRKAARKAAETRKLRKAAHEASARASDAARGARGLQDKLEAARAKLPKGQSTGTLRRGLEMVRNRLRQYSDGASLSTRTPESRGFTPWAIVGTISDIGLTYEDLHTALSDIEDDDDVMDTIGSRTLARMQVDYKGPLYGPDSKRKVRREWTIGEIGPFDVVLSRAVTALDPDEPGSVGERYNTGSIAESLTIWLSSALATDSGAF